MNDLLMRQAIEADLQKQQSQIDAGTEASCPANFNLEETVGPVGVEPGHRARDRHSGFTHSFLAHFFLARSVARSAGMQVQPRAFDGERAV